jgi:hypothetical protein
VVTNGAALRKRKVGELVHVLADDAKTLVRQEVELAKAELTERVEVLRTDLARDVADAKDELVRNSGRAAVGAGLLAGSALFGLVTLGLVAAMLTRLFDHAMPLGAALTLAFVGFAVIAAALAMAGRSRLKAAMPLVRPWTASQIRADAREAVGGNPVEQTVETIKEDVEWLKHPTRSEPR